MKGFFTIIIILYSLLVQAGNNFTLIEINPLHGHSQLTAYSDSAKTFYGAGELKGFTEMGGKIYFDAQNTPGDDELWVTDGTVSGTMMVKSINPGHGAAIGNLVYINNHILFMATDNGSDWDLWSTDGTDTGTVKIDELNDPWNTALSPNNVSVMGNRLIFCAQQKLLSSDGTATGTDSLLSIASYGTGAGYCEVNHNVYFVLPEVSGDYEIWRTDGTAAGTQSVLSLDSLSFNTIANDQMLAFNDKIYLLATDSGQPTALYTYDGSVNGSLNRVSISVTDNPVPVGLKLYDSALYFIANDSLSSNIYRIAEDSSAPQPLIPNSNISILSNLSFANNVVFAMEPGGKQIHAVNLNSFTATALNLTGYKLPIFPDIQNEFLVGADGQVFFEAYDSIDNNQVLMQSDLTDSGTHLLMPAGANTVHPFNSRIDSVTIQDVFDLQMWGSQIIIPANFTDAGRELWIYDLAAADGVKSISKNGAFQFYPNPSQGEIEILLDGDINQDPRITLTNTSGQIVLQQKLSSGATAIDISSFAQGQYIMTLSESGSTVSSKRIVLVK